MTLLTKHQEETRLGHPSSNSKRGRALREPKVSLNGIHAFGKFIVICMLANKDDGPTVPVADLGHVATEFTWQFESPEGFVFCSHETVFA